MAKKKLVIGTKLSLEKKGLLPLRPMPRKRAGEHILSDATQSGATLSGRVVVTGANYTLRGLTVKGELVFSGATNVTVEDLHIYAKECAIAVEADCDGVVLRDCSVSGDCGLFNAGRNTRVLTSLFDCGFRAIDDSGEASVVRDCVLWGTDGIVSSASDTVIMNNDIDAVEDGIVLQGRALNQLVAANTVACRRKKGDCIFVTGVRNAVILANDCEGDIELTCNRNIYVCQNIIGGRLWAVANNYILAESNVGADEEGPATVRAARNANENGDSLMDVDARLEVGADERLLPHVDKDLFVGMPRKATVTDTADRRPLTLPQYVMRHAGKESVVIIPPGAYISDQTWALEKEASDTVIFAYGVYAERQEELGTHILCNGVDNVSFRGLTLAYRWPSVFQAYVVEKMGDGTSVHLITGAGLFNEFWRSNPAICNNGWFASERTGAYYAYRDMWGQNGSVKLEDGTHLMYLPGDQYNHTRVGDVFCCRYTGKGDRTVKVLYSSNVEFRDVTMHGAAITFAFVEQENRSATYYYRVANTPRSAEVIDKETYDRYRALQMKYGVDFEVYVDEEGRFRGSPPHIGSVDATHASQCKVGSVCVSCLYENMCDDGTNQGHFHARLHAAEDNGDGTATLVYKGNLSSWAYGQRQRIPRTYCKDFEVGNRVYVYTAAGQLICDTPALTATEVGESIPVPEYESDTVIKRVKVAASAVNFAALAEWDLASNSHKDETKVCVDNMSYASNGFVFDNCMIRNNRSRGLLIKASDATVKNCTFRHVGMSCIAVLYEMNWGESGVTENLTVERNLIDQTGFFPEAVGPWPPKHYFRQPDLYAPISITGLGSRVDEDYLLYKNIRITGNKIMNRAHGGAAIYINSAKDVLIEGNDLGTVRDHGNVVRDAIHLKGVMNVEISDNLYPDPTAPAEAVYRMQQVKNVFGTDIEADEETGESIFACVE